MMGKNPQLGFTLYELIIVISIFTTAALVTGNYFIQSLNVNRFAIEAGDALDNAKKGLDKMAKELREASFAENGNYPIASAQNQSLTFFSDVDSDEGVEQVRYYLDATELKRTVIEPSGNPIGYTGPENTSIVAKYVRNGTDPLFYYYNANYPTDVVANPLIVPTSLNQIRMVKLLLTINVDPLVAPKDVTLSTIIQLRNLKDNL